MPARYGYAVAAAAVAAAAALRWLFDPLLGDRLPYVTFFVAVAVAAWHGGWRPALLASAAGFVVAVLLFVPPRLSFDVGAMSVPDRFGLATYFFVALAFAVLGEALHRARRRAEQRGDALAVTLASIGDGVLTTDLEGRITSLNPVAQALTGWSEHDAAGRRLDEVFRIVNEDTRATVDNPVLEVLAQGVIVGLANHTLLIARDGSERPIDDSAAPIRDAGGRLLGVVLVFRDVSERRRAEQALRRWQHIFDHAGWPVVVVDAESGALQAVNPAFAAMHGYAIEELIGQPLAIAFAPEDRGALSRHVEAAHARGGVRYESVHLRKDGSRFPCLTQATAYRDAHGKVAYRAATFLDLSEIRAAEQALRASEARKTAMLRTAFDGIVTIDGAGMVLDWNAAAERMFGWSRDAALGREMAELIVPPPVRAAHRAGMARHLAGGEARVLNRLVELRAARADGSEFAVEVAITAVAGEGAPLFVGYIRDITERKRAEGELRAARDELEARVAARTAELAGANRFMQALLESVDDGIVACDAGGVLTLFNRATREFHGLPQAPLPAEQWARHYDLYRADGSTPMTRDEVPLFRALAGERVRDVEMVIAPKQGAARSLLASGQAFRDDAGKLLGAVVSMHDVTERKRAEDALRRSHDELEARVASRTAELSVANDVLRNEVAERARAEALMQASEERFRNLADQAPMFIWLADRDVNVSYTNRNLLDYLGLADPGELQGRAWEQVIHPDDIAEVDAVYGGAFREQRAYTLECRFKEAATGQYRWFLFKGVPRLLADGEFIGFIGTAVDIEDQKRLERQLIDADRRKDEFLATLAHELRNPLAPLRNGLQVLRLAGADGAAAKQARAMMERQLVQMVRLLDDLLDISRISRGAFELRRETVALTEIVQHATETCVPFMEQHGHRLDVALPPQPIHLYADKARLSQALCNLLTNAARYTDPGGRIALTARADGGEASISVKDNGIGIAAEATPRLFEMFMQLDPSPHKARQGLGIGLAIVKRLVELHGGTVEVRSEGLGHGSEFVLRLPLEHAEAAPEPAVAPAPATAAAARRRVLVVDDNVDAADSLALVLDCMGSDARVAHDGRQALDVAAEFRPEIVLLDIGMPGLSGHDVARLMRRQPWGESLLLVAITGWGQQEDRRRSSEAGFDMHLVKPVDPAALEQLLGRAVPQRAGLPAPSEG